MSEHARGTFEVQLHAMPMEDLPKESMLGRMSADKQFAGDIVGTSKGQMLMVGTATTGSQVYVAVERVTATVKGKKGTFALYHTGVMDRGAPSLSVRVVPDSGTGDLIGLTGALSIEVKNGAHSYDFEYSLG